MHGSAGKSDAPCRFRERPTTRGLRLRRRILAAVHRLAFGSSTMDGLQLCFEPATLERVREALQLVKEADPLRWRRLQRYMPLMVETYGGSAFNDFFGTAFIDVDGHKSWRLAGAIVHELTHAYLHGRWQVPYRGEIKERHERVCLKEELRLYRRFITAFDSDEAEGKAWLEWVERRHQRALVSRWWERSRWELFRRSLRAFREREKEKERASGKA
ncbi:MAG TPA: hypothetical protein VFF12_00200 [Myxococcaceae bacterium]|nr:hypothetical protein [Myxococcaceae bacterium]